MDFKNQGHIDDAAFDDLMKDYLINEDTVLTNEAWEASGAMVFENEPLVVPSKEKEQQFLQQLKPVSSGILAGFWMKATLLIVLLTIGVVLIYNSFTSVENGSKENVAVLENELEIDEEMSSPQKTDDVTNEAPLSLSEDKSTGENEVSTDLIDNKGQENASKIDTINVDRAPIVITTPEKEEKSIAFAQNDSPTDKVEQEKREVRVPKSILKDDENAELEKETKQDENNKIAVGNGGGIGSIPVSAEENDQKKNKAKEEKDDKKAKSGDWHKLPNGQVTNSRKFRKYKTARSTVALEKYVGNYYNMDDGETFKVKIKKEKLFIRGFDHNVDFVSINQDSTSGVLRTDVNVIIFTREDQNVITGLYHEGKYFQKGD